jgi:hypothetical protein
LVTKMSISRSRNFSAFFVFLLLLAAFRASATTTIATSTDLILTSGANSTVSGGTVAAGNSVSLTASVSSGTAQVMVGEVLFCDASVSHCTDVHAIGTAELTSAGKATIRIVPAIGVHEYKAIFAGTPHGATAYGQSISSVQSLTVNGPYPTTTTLQVAGVPGSYTLTATIQGTGASTGPTGTVSVIDQSANHATLGSGTLGQASKSFDFVGSLSPQTDNSEYVVTGDFNGDGLADFAASNQTDGTVSIFLSNGDGTFTQPVGSPVNVIQSGQYVNAIVAGDFNRDGNLDVAVQVSGTIVVLTGSGDGKFSIGAPILLPSGHPALVLAVADLNQDGYLDLAVGAGGDTSALVAMLGNGDGTFNTASGIPTMIGKGPSSVVVGDFNGDGIPDVAVTALYGNNLTILLGNGDGSFSEAPMSPIAAIFPPDSAVAADFDQDGHLDLAVSDGVSALLIYIGNGDGTFTTAGSVTTGYGPWSVAYGDFNQDSVVDLVTANEDNSTATVLFGQRDGTFIAYPTELSVGSNPNSVAAGPFTTDGKWGFVEANGSHFLQIYHPQITETATATTSSIAPSGSGTHQVAAVYGGDNLFAGSSSAATSLTATGFSVIGTSVSVSAGAQTGNASTVSLTPSGGFTGNVTLTAAITSSPAGATNPPALSFGTTSPAVISGTAGTSAVLTITTTASSAGCTANFQRPGLPWKSAGGVVLACMLLFVLPGKRRQSIAGFFILLLLSAGAVTACGGGAGGRTVCSNAGHAGTTPGAYTITVTATSGSNNSSGNITLTVQ